MLSVQQTDKEKHRKEEKKEGRKEGRKGKDKREGGKKGEKIGYFKLQPLCAGIPIAHRSSYYAGESERTYLNQIY